MKRMMEMATAHLGTAISVLAAIVAVISAAIAYSGNKTAELQTRAYIAIEGGGFQLVNLNTGGQGIKAYVEFENSGTTPAYEFSTWTRPPQILAPDAVPFGTEATLEERPNKSIVGPGAKANVEHVFAVKSEDLEKLQSGVTKIFWWGGVNYTDIYGKGRFFRFRAVSGAPVKTGNQIVFPLQPHKQGYEAD